MTRLLDFFVFVSSWKCVLTFIFEGYFPCVWIIVWQLLSYRLSKDVIPHCLLNFIISVGIHIASFNEMCPFLWILSFLAVLLELSPNLHAAQNQFYYDKHWCGVSVLNVFMIELNRNYKNWNTIETKARKIKNTVSKGSWINTLCVILILEEWERKWDKIFEKTTAKNFPKWLRPNPSTRSSENMKIIHHHHYQHIP